MPGAQVTTLRQGRPQLPALKHHLEMAKISRTQNSLGLRPDLSDQFNWERTLLYGLIKLGKR